jgi:hypothetical protein
MSKSTITALFVGAIAAVAVGSIIGIAAGVAAIANGVVTIGGPTVVTINGSAFAGVVGWLAIAAVAIAAGSVAAVASWVGALLNTARLEDKTWFAVVLILGLFSFGWVAMAAYVFFGPDGTENELASSGVVTVGRS